MRKFLTIATVAMLAGCSAAAQAAPLTEAQAQTRQISTQTGLKSLLDTHRLELLHLAIRSAERRVGRTWYVFSGDTPAGWDCSGLTRWVYEQSGITLPHSANKQAHIGHRVRTPRRGDLVLFGYPNTDTYYHAAIYLSAGKILHAGFRRGTTTAILPLSSPMLKGAKVIYVRIIY